MKTIQRPFDDLKFSCTGVPNDLRSELASIIGSMGGIYCNNLMSDVSVLIVGDKNTDKFQFSVMKRYDMIFIDPQEVKLLHKRWIDGENIFNSTSNDKFLGFIHRLPVFQNMKICLSRISKDLVEESKEEIAQLIRAEKGNVTDSLTQNINVLVTTEKSGKRYMKALEWKIPAVHPKWVTDSLKRAASLSYKYFDITSDNYNPKTIGRGACEVWDQLEKFENEYRERLNKRSIYDTEGGDPLDNTGNDEVRRTKKNKSSLNAWDSILKSFNGEVPEKKENNELKRNVDVIPEIEEESPKQLKLFKDQLFLSYGFDAKQLLVLTKIIKSHGAKFQKLSKNDLLNSKNYRNVKYLIIPHDLLKSKTLSDIKDFLLVNDLSLEIITEWFVERCLYYGKVKQDLWGNPMLLNDKVKDFLKKKKDGLDKENKLKVSISGFSGVELLHLEKLLESLSKFIQFKDVLTKSTDLLIINTSLIGLNEKNSKKLFESNNPKVCQLIQDIECNNSSLKSMKKKLVFCQNNHIPIYSLNFLFELFIRFDDSAITTPKEIELSNLKWCIYFPNSLNHNQLERFVKLFFPTVTKSKPQLARSSSSTIKSSRKEWGKLSGKASESSLNQTSEAQFVSASTNNSENHKEEEEVYNGTQIVYGKERKVSELRRTRGMDLY